MPFGFECLHGLAVIDFHQNIGKIPRPGFDRNNPLTRCREHF